MLNEINNTLSSRKNAFERKIKPVLNYVGTIGAIITSIAYIILVCILIFGFKAQTLSQTITFAVVNSLTGIIIVQFLKIQGISFAKNLEENASILKEYNNTHTKDKKPLSIKYFWITSVIKDIVIKALLIAIFTSSVIYIVIEGSQNYALFGMAIVNLLLFLCFGMLSLTSAYDFFNDKHIPYIRERLEEIKNKKEIIDYDNTSEWGTTQKSSGTSTEE